MTWTEAEKDALWAGWCAREHEDVVERCHALASRAVELMAARGGTMTAEQFEAVLSVAVDGTFEAKWAARDAIRQHIAAQGAKVAALEAALREVIAECSNRAQGESMLREQYDAIGAELATTEAERKRLAELASVTELIAARRERDEARRTIDGIDTMLGDAFAAGVAPGARRDRVDSLARAVADRDRLARELGDARAELARLKPSGQVAEDAARVTGALDSLEARGMNAGIPRAALSRLTELAQRAQDGGGKTMGGVREQGGMNMPSTASGRTIIVNETGLHDPFADVAPTAPDAETVAVARGALGLSSPEPHGEDAKEALEIVVESDAYERAAEAMRAACWEAVASRLEAEGYDRGGALLLGLKAAIEGATP